MLRVRDIMTQGVVSLAPERTLESARWTFASAHVSGAPVRDRAGRVIGVLSKSDLVDPVQGGSQAETVGEAMTSAVWAMQPDDPAIDAVRLMLEQDVHRILVLEGPGKLVGIVTSMDVLRAISRGATFEDGQNSQEKRNEAKGSAR